MVIIIAVIIIIIIIIIINSRAYGTSSNAQIDTEL